MSKTNNILGGLAFITPMCHELVVDGIVVTVKPFRVGQFPVAMGLAHPMLDMAFGAAPVVQQVIAAATNAAGEIDTSVMGAGLTPILMAAIEKHGDTVIELVSLATDQPAEWVGELYADRLCVLAALVLEVNADFFSRAMPLLKGLGAKIKALGAPALSVPTAPAPQAPEPSQA